MLALLGLLTQDRVFDSCCMQNFYLVKHVHSGSSGWTSGDSGYSRSKLNNNSGWNCFIQCKIYVKNSSSDSTGFRKFWSD